MNYKAALTVLVLFAAAGLGMFAFADAADADDPSSAASYGITGEGVVATETTSEYTIEFSEATAYSDLSVTYTATLTKDGNTISSGVTPSSGSISDGKTATLTLASQDTSGNYKITVVFTETVTFEGASEEKTYTYETSLNVKIMQPITLSINLENTGKTDIYKSTVVFYVDGTLVEGSETEVTVAAGATTTVTYDYLPDGLSSGKHTYYIVSADETEIGGIGADHKSTFYYNQGNNDLFIYIAAIFVVLMAILLIWVFRKPVKNRGKPKARK